MTTWLEAVTKGAAADAPKKAQASNGVVSDWLGHLARTPMHPPVARKLEEALQSVGNGDRAAHDVMLAASRALIGYGAGGCAGVPGALNKLRDGFLTEVASRRRSARDAEAEWDRAIKGAVQLELAGNPSPWVCRCPGEDDLAVDESPGEIRLLRADTIKPEHIKWLDEGRIPLRVVSLVVGIDGVGKSTVLYTKAAQATRGLLPGDLFGQPCDVLVASVEDDAASVILPRLVAAGADLARVHILTVERDGLKGEINLPDDLPKIEAAMEAVAARLLIIDPLVAYMPLQYDTHKTQHIRRVMAPLAKLAEAREAAVAAVVHFNGANSTDVRTRISGAKAIRDASRSVLVCANDPDDESRFIMAQDKSSLGGRKGVGWAYEIEGVEVQRRGESYKTIKINWLGEVQITTTELLGVAPDADERSQRDDAMDVIRLILETGPKTWENMLPDIRRRAACSQATARRAREALKRSGEIDRQKVPGSWEWSLVNPPAEPVATVTDLESVRKRREERNPSPPACVFCAQPATGTGGSKAQPVCDSCRPPPSRGRGAVM